MPAPGQAKKIAMLGSLDHVTRQLIVHTSPTKRSSDFVAHLEELDRLYGPRPGQPAKPVVLVEDNGPIHTSKLSMAALAARAHWLTVEWLPKHAPELNDIEVVWRDLKGITWLIRPLPTLTRWTGRSTTPWTNCGGPLLAGRIDGEAARGGSG